ncbi:hypothetical protein PENSPDRAFT_313552 [Peniophora sp. CONT]|nr:hypothetical protein PENSPDRAFT_313552 [Peniophora sp. CONT]
MWRLSRLHIGSSSPSTRPSKHRRSCVRGRRAKDTLRMVFVQAATRTRVLPSSSVWDSSHTRVTGEVASEVDNVDRIPRSMRVPFAKGCSASVRQHGRCGSVHVLHD